VGADQDAREDVAEHDRLAQALEQHRGDGGDAEDERERCEEVMGLVHDRGLGTRPCVGAGACQPNPTRTGEPARARFGVAWSGMPRARWRSPRRPLPSARSRGPDPTF
jgi:hypothetical protein